MFPPSQICRRSCLRSPGLLSSPEQLENLVRPVVPVKPQAFLFESAFTVYDPVAGNCHFRGKIVHQGFRQQNGERIVLGFDKRIEQARVFIYVDRDHLYVFQVLHLFVEFLHTGKLFAARPAPRGPDIDERPLALQVCHGPGLSAEIGRVQFRERLVLRCPHYDVNGRRAGFRTLPPFGETFRIADQVCP